MIRKTRTLLLLATMLLGCNCSPLKSPEQSLEIPPSTEIPTRTQSDTTSPIITPESTKTHKPVPTAREVMISDTCRTLDSIEVDELDLPNGVGLLIFDRDAQAEVVRYVSPRAQSSRKVFDPLTTSGQFIGVSPDGKWILIMTQEDSEDDDGHPTRKLFVRSLLGDEEWLLASIKYEGSFYFGELFVTSALTNVELSHDDVKFGPGAGWDSDRTVHVTSQGAGGTSLSQAFPVISIDIFTGEIKPFFDSTSYDLGDWYLGRYKFGQKSLDLYFTQFDTCADCFGRFFFYDHLSKEEIPVFSWLDKEEWMNWYITAIGKTDIWQVKNGFVNLLVIKEYGIDVALHLSMEDSKFDGSYESQMTPLVIPPASFQSKDQDLLDLGGFYPEWLSSHSSLAIFQGITSEGDRYYLADFEKYQIQEFCRSMYFPISNPSETDDARFLAWDRWNGFTSDTIIYDIELSKITKIENAEFVGWAFIPE